MASDVGVTGSAESATDWTQRLFVNLREAEGTRLVRCLDDEGPLDQIE